MNRQAVEANVMAPTLPVYMQVQVQEAGSSKNRANFGPA
jgi:hypothetical protein